MLTHVDWSTSVALDLDAQLVASKANPTLRSLLRRVLLAETGQQRRVLPTPAWGTIAIKTLGNWRFTESHSCAKTKERAGMGHRCVFVFSLIM